MGVKNVIIRNMRQTAIWWRNGNTDPALQSPYPDATPLEGTVISCRWEDNIVDAHTQTADPIDSAARVFVNSKVTVGDFLYLLKEGENPTPLLTQDPRNVEKAGKVIRKIDYPTLDNTFVFRKLFLSNLIRW